jgi:DNA replication protein
LEKQWWKERFIDRRSWILDHLQELTMNSEEALTILLIDFMNEHDMNISHGVLAEKLKKDLEDIDNILSGLSAKGYLQIRYHEKKIAFSIDGIFTSLQEKTMHFDESLFDVFEMEFGRPLSQMELQRMSDWIENYDQKLIQYALREAIMFDKKSFDYIERILIEWKNRGLQVQDIEDGKR